MVSNEREKLNMTNEKRNNEQQEKSENIKNAAIAGAETEIVQRYGSAVKEHSVAYSGVDNEIGKQLQRGLKNISEANVNPDYKKTNLKQQAGFAAEEKSVAKGNAENIIHRDKKRYTRTDDIKKQKYGNNDIGGTNDQLYDIALFDEVNIIDAEQLKFIKQGKTAAETIDALCTDKSYQKYFDKDIKLGIATDKYNFDQRKLNKEISALKEKLKMGGLSKSEEKRIQEKIRLFDGTKNASEYAEKKATLLMEQADEVESRGKKDAAEKLRATARKYKQFSKNVADTKVTEKEAMFARLHPKLSTAQDIAKLSHRAGVQGAAIGAGIAGISSIIQNLVAYAKGEKTAEEAGKSVVLSTGKGSVIGYATAFAGAAIKGAMQNSKQEITRAISKTSFPAQIVSITIEVSNTMRLYLLGEIDGVECLSMLGEQGCGMLSSSMFATIGGAAGAVAGPAGIAVGGMIGGMVGYVFNSAFYGLLKDSLTEAKFAHEYRLQIETECAQAINLAKEYQEEIQKTAQKYFSEYLSVFNSSFDLMKQAIESDDIDLFIKGNQGIQNQLGYKSQFSNFSEFDGLMNSSDSLKL